jgi:amidase
MAGCNTFPVVVGPICRSARDNYYFHKVVIDAEPWRIDPSVVALPWRELPLPNKITVGIFSWDQVCMPHPPITAAIKILKQKLESHPDFEVVDWEPYDHDRGYEIIRRLYYEDAGDDNYNTMASTGEPSLPLSDWIMKPPFAKRCTVEEAWALNVRRADYQSAHLPFHPTSLTPFPTPRGVS